MQIIVTASKGGVGCSSIAYLAGMLFPNRMMYSNDPWHIPDDSIKTLNSVEEYAALTLDSDVTHIFDISTIRNEALANTIAKKADMVLIPCSNDLQSVSAAMVAYKRMAKLCKKRLIVINGFRSRNVRTNILQHLISHGVRPKDIVALRDSRLMNRIFTYGPMWRDSVRDGKGLHRLNRTLEIFENILSDAIC